MDNWHNVSDEWKQRIADCLDGLEYGSVQIVIHDAQIVQIERIERHRFEVQKAQSSVKSSSKRQSNRPLRRVDLLNEEGSSN